MLRVLVTGANGFIGNVLCEMLAGRGYRVRAAARTGRELPACIDERAEVGSLDGHTEWTRAVDGIDCVIHLAARVHVSNARPGESRRLLEANAYGTRRLAEQAVRNGVSRLLFLSTVKVNGEQTAERPFSSADAAHPQDAYGTSKWRAEQLLAETSAATGLQIVIVRPPLVYGAGVRANFLRLLRWVDHERWLPLGAVDNRRSFVSVWNLCDLLIRLLEHPAAPGRTWMVSDGQDISTPQLVRRIAELMGRRPRLLSVPPSLLYLAGEALRQRAAVRRLCGSLTVDISATRELLGWSPPLSLEEGLAGTVDWYRLRAASALRRQ